MTFRLTLALTAAALIAGLALAPQEPRPRIAWNTVTVQPLPPAAGE